MVEEPRACIRCGSPALAGRNSCNECGGTVVNVASAEESRVLARTAAAASPADWGPWASERPTPAEPGMPDAEDTLGFQPGEAHVAPELRRRGRNAVVAANFMIVFVVIAVVAIALIGWSMFGGGGRSTKGVPANLRAYAAGTGGLPYQTTAFTVRLPDSYKVDSGTMPVGGYEIRVTGATAHVDSMIVGVASGSLPTGAAQFAQSHLQYVGEQSLADLHLSADAGHLTTHTWHGRPAYDIDYAEKDVQIHARIVAGGKRYVVFVVAGPKGSDAVMAALLDSYHER